MTALFKLGGAPTRNTQRPNAQHFFRKLQRADRELRKWISRLARSNSK